MHTRKFDIEDRLGGFIIQTTRRTTDPSDKDVISTYVIIANPPNNIVYAGDSYKNALAATMGHLDIVDDVKNHPERYTVERFERKIVIDLAIRNINEQED